MLLCALEESRCHTALVDRIDFVKVDNQPARRIEKPWPLAIGTLPRNQLPGAGIRDFNCSNIVRKFTISVAGERQVGLGGKGRKPPPQSECRVEKQPGWGMIPIDQKRE